MFEDAVEVSQPSARSLDQNPDRSSNGETHPCSHCTAFAFINEHKGRLYLARKNQCSRLSSIEHISHGQRGSANRNRENANPRRQ